MLLHDVLQDYLSTKDVSAEYADQLGFALRDFEKRLAHRARLADLSPPAINDWAKSRGDVSGRTRRNYLKSMLTLWRFAADSDLCAPPPMRKIVKIVAPPGIPRAWTKEEAERMLVAARRMRGTYNGISKALYWESYIRAAWDTGWRPSDLRSLEIDWLSETLIVIQHKTKKVVRSHLHPETIACIRSTFPPQRRLIWPLWASLQSWKTAAKRLAVRAGLSGSVGRLRASSGTAVEVAFPGRGHTHLGNSRAVFERHYLDSRHTMPGQCLAPPLELP